MLIGSVPCRAGALADDSYLRALNRNRCRKVVAIAPASNRLRRTRLKRRRDAHTFGLFVIEKRSEDGRWPARSTRRTVRAAQDCAWDLLTREGGEVRVRQGQHIVAEGVSFRPSGVDGEPSATSD